MQMDMECEDVDIDAMISGAIRIKKLDAEIEHGEERLRMVENILSE